MEWNAVSGQHRFEIQFFHLVERGNPLIEKRVAHVGRLRFHQVAAAHDSLFRQINHRVTLRMPATEKQQLDFAGSLKYGHF